MFRLDGSSWLRAATVELKAESQVRMAGRSKSVSHTVAIGVAALLLPAVVTTGVAQEAVVVDRWLVSSPFPADSTGDPLDPDYLAGSGEAGVLPDRGRTVSGADWKLVRRDSAATLDLEDLREQDGGQVVVYAHAYLKSPEDRTISLTWGGLDCTAVSAWLNGRSLAGLGHPRGRAGDARTTGNFQADVRIGFGYNTLLIEAASGDCPFGVTASLAPTSAGSLDGVRVQASRPYGDTRTGPAPWLIADRDAGPEPLLGWKQDELFGVAGIRLTAFAVTAIQGAKLKVKTGGEEVKRQVEWLTPAEPETVLMPFTFENLRRAVTRGEGAQLELDWDDGKMKDTLRLDPAALLEAFHSSIRLLGWTGPTEGTLAPSPTSGQDGTEEEEEPHPLAHLIPLPTEAGVTLIAEWEVPGWLSGFTLRLDVDGAPGEYRVDSIPVEGDEIVLCTGCRKGDGIQLVVRTGGEWTRFPGVSIVEAAPPANLDTDSAIRWLDLLDEKGSRKYREQAAGASGR